MFGWLADLLLKSPVVGSSCPCCEGQKKQLKQMQKAVLSGQIDNTEEEEEEMSCSCCSCAKESEETFDMTTTYHYRL